MSYFSAYEPLLAKMYGQSRVSQGSAKLRVSGKVRPVPFLVVNFG